MYVVLESQFAVFSLGGPRGTAEARCHLDTGGGWTFVSQRLADQLGLEVESTQETEEGTFTLLTPPTVTAGGRPVDLSPRPVCVGPDHVFARTGSDMFIGAAVLAQHHAVFDYPERRLTLSDRPTGGDVRVASPVDEQSKFARVEITVAGEAHGMLLDTGASHTMLSAAVFDRWRAEHPDWTVWDGAIGTANMNGQQADLGARMMRVPEMRIGDVVVENATVVTRPAGTFENWMSQMMAAPIVGALAGNVLEQLRLEVDYQEACTHFSPGQVSVSSQWVAPVVLAATDDGLVIAESHAPGVDAGSVLVAVEGEAVATFAAAAAALSSAEPGQRRLTLRDPAREVMVELVDR
jgi:hypothetical protein